VRLGASGAASIAPVALRRLMSRWLRPRSGSAPAALGPVRLRVVPPAAPVPPPPQYAGRCAPLGCGHLRRGDAPPTVPLPLRVTGGSALRRFHHRPSGGSRGGPPPPPSCPAGQAGLRCCRPMSADVTAVVVPNGWPTAPNAAGAPKPPPCPCKRRTPPVLCPAAPGQSTAGLHRR
jgi:hypothetical protein